MKAFQKGKLHPVYAVIYHLNHGKLKFTGGNILPIGKTADYGVNY